MTIVPLYNRVILKPQKDGSVSATGLIVPAVVERNSPFRYGEVIAVGPGVPQPDGTLRPCSVKVGAIVIFSRNAGQAIPNFLSENGPSDDDELVVMTEEFILGMVHDLPIKTTLLGVDGRLLQMVPQSRTQSGFNQGALHDSSYLNQEGLDRAEKDWGIDCSDHVDEVSH